MPTPQVWIVIACAGALSCGCTPRAAEGGFNSADPASKLHAIVRAGEQRDRTAIPDLIEQLESDDDAVRMYAIEALRRITARDYDYVFYDPPHRRRAAVQRWVEAYRSGELDDPPAEPSAQ